MLSTCLFADQQFYIGNFSMLLCALHQRHKAQLMPLHFNYGPILALASPPRMASYQLTFAPASNTELYGIYVWAQHVVGALYPITQNVEIALRNAIDKEARRRFLDFWWTRPEFNGPGTGDFQNNLMKAKANLDRAWRSAERKRLGLASNAPIPTAPPAWSHDKIVAATDFSTWQYILRDDFASPTSATHADHLWPLSMHRVFRNFNMVDPSSAIARTKILDLVHEIREYRNRLFHHDKIWMHTGPHMTAQLAIDSIRRKINRMETLLKVLDKRLVSILEKTGVLANARRVCSLNDLDIFRYAHTEQPLTRRKKRVLRSITGRAKHENATQAWSYGGRVYGIYPIR
jgi:hypothetical protein